MSVVNVGYGVKGGIKMQEVFEKIKAKIKELAWKRNIYDGKVYVTEVSNMIDEVAKEHNNGWIPVSEGLPEEYKLYDITFKNSAGTHSDSAIFNTYLKKWFWDADETELVENEILAWAEKREPYQPRRVNRNE